MPLPIAHGLVGASIVALVHSRADSRNWKPLLLGFVLANSPDFDFAFSFFLGAHDFHRGFTHSLLFALIVASIIFTILKRNNRQNALAYSIAFLSHTILDYVCAKDGGVRLLMPFDYTAYKLGQISFSELSRGFVLQEMLYFSLLEILVFVPLFCAAIFLSRKMRNVTLSN
jgi:inner membrane protein